MNVFGRIAPASGGGEAQFESKTRAPRPGKILVATKAGANRASLTNFLFNREQTFVIAETAREVLLHLKAGGFELVVSALRDADGFELMRLVRRTAPGLPVIVMALGDGQLDAASLDFATGLKREVFGESVAARFVNLTARERQVLGLVVAGRTNKVIAYELTISPRTVENHRSRIMEKLRVRSVAELVRLALGAEQTARRDAMPMMTAHDMGACEPPAIAAA